MTCVETNEHREAATAAGAEEQPPNGAEERRIDHCSGANKSAGTGTTRGAAGILESFAQLVVALAEPQNPVREDGGAPAAAGSGRTAPVTTRISEKRASQQRGARAIRRDAAHRTRRSCEKLEQGMIERSPETIALELRTSKLTRVSKLIALSPHLWSWKPRAVGAWNTRFPSRPCHEDLPREKYVPRASSNSLARAAFDCL